MKTVDQTVGEDYRNRYGDESFEGKPRPLTDDEREQTASDEYYERLDAAARYALPIQRVSLWDEPKGMR